MMSDMTTMLFETRPSANGKLLAIATLNAEKTLNALSIEMVDMLYAQLLAWQDDEQVAAVLVQAAGEKAFCAGGDVQKLRQSSVDNPGGPCDYAESFFEREYRLDHLIHAFAKPMICWGHGIVMGGGLGLMAGCKHRVVTERTRMAMPEITIALYPDVGGSYFLNQAPGRSGLYLALTAASLNAADCLFVGYGDHFIEHAKKEDVLTALLNVAWSGVSEQDSTAITELLKSVSANCGDSLPAANVEPHFEIIQQLSDYPTLAEVIVAITGYESDDKWLNKGAAALAHGSPLSAANIYQALQLTADMSLAEVFRFELMLSTNVIRHPEFAEGVRALLIDKDQQPDWQYKSVQEVPADLLAKMVTAPWPENPLADL